MLDAATGHELWRADTTSPIPAGVAVLDTDADEYADRMYALDVRGGVWRFDIWNGHPRDTLATGGVIADLREAAVPGRRFFNAPDVALIQPRGGAPYYSIAIGSGDPTAHASVSLLDRFYALRDRVPFDARSQASYDAAKPILFTDLVDGTQPAPDAPGWTLALAPGEKVAASAITVNGVVMFTTFQPDAESSDCVVTGSTRIYVVRADTARASIDLDGDGKITSADVSLRMPTLTEPAAVVVHLGAPDASDSRGSDGGGDSTSNKPVVALIPECVVGGITLKTCASATALIRTFWYRRGVK
jgi:type IV pilus assembly protein PilY1